MASVYIVSVNIVVWETRRWKGFAELGLLGVLDKPTQCEPSNAH